jgi:membrane-bound lytic murein transglycosylase D
LSANKNLNRGQNTRWISATALCGLLTFLLIGWEHTQNAPPGTQALWTGEEVVPSALAEMEMELRNVHLPMEVNEAVESWMVRFATDRKSVFEEVLSRAGLYSDMIQTKLRDRGMPEELLYLAMIESDFHVDARSRVMATGMWQFMGPTARQYGLRMDAYVDERYDPIRATDAALDYLSVLYEQYGSWYLAAAAYNAGPTRVSGILRRYTDGRRGDESLYWEVVDHLPAETAQYVPKLLAATYLARSAERYGLEVTQVEAYAYDFVWSPGGVDLGQVAEALGISARSMYDLNPQLIRRVTPPGEIYPLRVPVGTASQVVAALAVPNRRSRLADD